MPPAHPPRSTSRLTLRPPTEADLPRLLEIRRDPEVVRWLLSTRVDPVEYRRRILDALEDPDRHPVVALLEDTIVGTGSVEVVDGLGQDLGTEHRRSEGSLGYLLDPAYAGRGLGTDLARALLRLAFTDLGLRRVTAGCFADNVASWRVMEKVGMRREQHGVADSWHAERGWLDGFTYAVLASEWPG